MKRLGYIGVALVLLAMAGFGCSGSLSESGGTYTVSVPSSDSVDAKVTDDGSKASVVGGPIQSESAIQQ